MEHYIEISRSIDKRVRKFKRQRLYREIVNWLLVVSVALLLVYCVVDLLLVEKIVIWLV